MNQVLEKRAVDCFMGRCNIEITKTNGRRIVLLGTSLDIFGDPITGRTPRGKYVRVYKKDVQDINSAF
jgi:hypothetical protein